MRNAFVTAVYFSTLAIVLPMLLLAVLVASPVVMPWIERGGDSDH